MRNDQYGLVGCHHLQALLELLFRGEIHRTRWLIEQEDRRVHQEGPRDSHALPLTTRERITPLADHHVKTIRMAIDELGQATCLGSSNNGGIISVGCANRDVVPQGSIKQRDILRHVSNVAPKVGRVQLPKVDAINADSTASRLVQAEQQFLQGRLA